jgi:plastocyanin
MRRTAGFLLLAFALLGLAACGSSSKPATPPPPPPPTDLRGKTAVEIDASGNQFSPPSIIIDEGTKVTWRNTDPTAHNVKKSADAVDFGAPFGVDSDKFGPGKTYSFTFAKPGTYAYQCTIHAGMTGTVEVRAKA